LLTPHTTPFLLTRYPLEQGQWKGCTCNTPVFQSENVIGAAEYQDRLAAVTLFKELKGRPKVRKAKVTCRHHPLSAPRNDKDASGGTSVEEAIDAWCKDNDGKDVGSDGLYARWGVTRLDVPNRSSFFLRAARTCGSADKFNRWECKRALMEGMEECDKGPETNGLAASVACLDYSIDLSGVTYDGMPPWAEKEEDFRFPPPEGIESGVRCYGGHTYRPLSDEDLNKTIDAFCQDGKEIQGYGKMFDFPPKNEPQFYSYEVINMHLTVGAELSKNSEPTLAWCRHVSLLL
jgi:hypothetical protein